MRFVNALRYVLGRLISVASFNLFQNTLFLHSYHIAHLDICLHNLLTDCEGHYACIDYECSRQFTGIHNPRVRNLRMAEEPPEVEHREDCDPYKVDIWSLAVLILRACKVSICFFREITVLKWILADRVLCS
jgi:serine/threonine protein kinase